eukprot:m.13219 g.13219  ORF g.13219 m.13219 type:complete len:306 (+) comp5918_c0_seq1:54-971(+)
MDSQSDEVGDTATLARSAPTNGEDQAEEGTTSVPNESFTAENTTPMSSVKATSMPPAIAQHDATANVSAEKPANTLAVKAEAQLASKESQPASDDLAGDGGGCAKAKNAATPKPKPPAIKSEDIPLTASTVPPEPKTEQEQEQVQVQEQDQEQAASSEPKAETERPSSPFTLPKVRSILRAIDFETILDNAPRDAVLFFCPEIKRIMRGGRDGEKALQQIKIPPIVFPLGPEEAVTPSRASYTKKRQQSRTNTPSTTASATANALTRSRSLSRSPGVEEPEPKMATLQPRRGRGRGRGRERMMQR